MIVDGICYAVYPLISVFSLVGTCKEVWEL